MSFVSRLLLSFFFVFCACTNAQSPISQGSEPKTVDAQHPDISIVYVTEPFRPIVDEPAPLLKNALVVGDSQACGMSLHIYKLAKKEGVEISQRCKVGSRISYWEKRLPQGKFGSIILVLGSNDYEQKTSEGSIDALLDAVKERTNHCLWVGPPLIRKKESSVPGLIQNAAIAHRCSYFDSRNLSLPQPDGVHSTPSGYKRWMNESVMPFLGFDQLE